MVDYLLDFLDLSAIPQSDHTIVTCSSSCNIHDLKSFTVTKDLNELTFQGKFLVKINSELEKGFLLSYLSLQLRPKIYSHRPEILQKILRLNVLPLSFPDSFFSSLKIPLKEKNTPISNNSSPTCTFNQIYKESLEKYAKVVLTCPNKSSKVKSAKSQIKNIIEGIMTHYESKGTFFDFSCEDVLNAIVFDLESNDVLSISSIGVFYNKENIQSFFCDKNKEFISRFQKGGERIQKKTDEGESIDQDKILAEIEKEECRTIGELHYLISTKLREKTDKELAIKQIVEKAMGKYFEAKEDVAEILSDLHGSFSVNLKRK